MLNKIVITAVVLLVLLFVYQHKTSKTEKIDSSDIITNESKKKPIIEKNLTPAKSKELTAKIQELKDKEQEMLVLLRKELAIAENEDALPIIQKLAAQLSSCRQLKIFEYKVEKSIVVFSKKQIKLYKDSKSKCQEFSEKYKYFSSIYYSGYDATTIQNILVGDNSSLEYPAKKRSRKLTKAEINQYTENITQEFLTAKNSFVLENVFAAQQQSQFLVRNTSVAKTLNSYNLDYIGMINQQALTLISCDFNNSYNCDEAGIFMQKECFANEQACGMRVKEWFNYAFTDAHLNDIDLVVNYYLNLDIET